MLHDASAVMLEPVADQNRLSVCGFDQVFQHFQFPAVNDSGFLVFVIDRAVSHLEQLVGERGSVGSIDISVLKRNDKILFQLIV